MRSLVVLVDFLVKPAFAERFGELIAANAEASLKRERGCRSKSICAPATIWTSLKP